LYKSLRAWCPRSVAEKVSCAVRGQVRHQGVAGQIPLGNSDRRPSVSGIFLPTKSKVFAKSVRWSG